VNPRSGRSCFGQSASRSQIAGAEADIRVGPLAGEVKSVVVTPEGLARAKALFAQMFET
jgi:hypothetical protein